MKTRKPIGTVLGEYFLEFRHQISFKFDSNDSEMTSCNRTCDNMLIVQLVTEHPFVY
jgi:hypothetical protein